MKLRLFIMGCIIPALGAILLAVRGFSADLVEMLAVGI
jgi:hypothetical protein